MDYRLTPMLGCSCAGQKDVYALCALHQGVYTCCILYIYQGMSLGYNVYTACSVLQPNVVLRHMTVYQVLLPCPLVV